MIAKKEWQNGWWLGAQRLDSPNHCARSADEKISLIVLHSISLPPFEYGNDAVAKFFTNQLLGDEHPFFSLLTELRVSSHFFITRKGEIIQFVSCDDVAYHAGRSSFRGRDNCNNFSIGIELEGCDFEPFSAIQYQYLNKLLAAIIGVYPIEAITGHQYIAPERKSDPGHFFEWNQLETMDIEVVY